MHPWGQGDNRLGTSLWGQYWRHKLKWELWTALSLLLTIYIVFLSRKTIPKKENVYLERHLQGSLSKWMTSDLDCPWPTWENDLRPLLSQYCLLGNYRGKINMLHCVCFLCCFSMIYGSTPGLGDLWVGIKPCTYMARITSLKMVKNRGGNFQVNVAYVCFVLPTEAVHVLCGDISCEPG